MKDFEVEIEPGIWLGQKLIPVANVGCYIPGGKYPLISAAIMSIGTARAAGVDHVIACAPPRDSQGIYPPQLYALHTAGADEIYVLGGVQALAAMAFGCVGMRAVDMITGPGNPYVAEAKRQLFGQVGIDLLAGPTEICVIADETADPSLVATDLLGQAEHGPDSPVWLITTSEQLGNLVIRDVERQLTTLPTAALAGAAWNNNGEVVVVDNDDEAIAVSDEYAPEHLELMTQRNDYYQERLTNYGSLFVGEESTVAYGDKGVGTNHTLTDWQGSALHRRPLGRKIHQDRHLSETNASGEPSHRPGDGSSLSHGRHAGARAHRRRAVQPLSHPATRSSSQFLSAKNQRENIPFSEEMQRDLSGCSGEKEWHLACDRPNFWSEHIL